MIPKNSVPAKVLRQKIADLLGSDGGCDAVVDFLLAELLIDARHLQAWVVCGEVRKLLDKGWGKMDAMTAVAEQVGLSFYTVRKYVYSTYK